MAHKISPTQLKPGTYINLYGTIEFSHVTRLFEGQELAREQQRRQMNGMLIPDKPFTSITISNPKVLASNPNGTKTLEEQYIEESFYNSKSNPGAMMYNLDNKSTNFPRFYQVKVNDDGTIDNKHVDEVPARAELAKGLKVILILRVFKPKNYPNCGISLDAIIAQEPIRYYQAGGAVSHLAQMGITVSELSEDARESAAKQAQAQSNTNIENDNNPVTGPVNAQPVQAPVGNPYATGPAATAAKTETPASMPAPTTAPVTENPVPTAAVSNGTWVCPNCGNSNTGKFCNECATPKPAEQTQMGTQIGGGNPYTSQDVLGQARTGIKFDPNDNNRNY